MRYSHGILFAVLSVVCGCTTTHAPIDSGPIGYFTIAYPKGTALVQAKAWAVQSVTARCAETRQGAEVLDVRSGPAPMVVFDEHEVAINNFKIDAARERPTITVQFRCRTTLASSR